MRLDVFVPRERQILMSQLQEQRQGQLRRSTAAIAPREASRMVVSHAQAPVGADLPTTDPHLFCLPIASDLHHTLPARTGCCVDSPDHHQTMLLVNRTITRATSIKKPQASRLGLLRLLPDEALRRTSA